MRSIHTEMDYSKKDATRHIVANKGAGSKGDSLRQKLLRNLESVRKNKPLLKSETGGSHLSVKSKYSKLSARMSQACGNTNMNDGRLTRIDEDGNETIAKCEACAKEVTADEDLAMNQDITQ